MADQNQRPQALKLPEALSQLGLAIFAGRVEWSGIRIAQPRHKIAADLQRLPVKVAESKLIAEANDVGFRFMIARQHVHLLGTALQYRPKLVQPATPIRQVAGSEIVIRLDVHQTLKRGLIAVNVGKNEELHAIARHLLRGCWPPRRAASASGPRDRPGDRLPRPVSWLPPFFRNLPLPRSRYS